MKDIRCLFGRHVEVRVIDDMEIKGYKAFVITREHKKCMRCGKTWDMTVTP